MLTYQQEQFMGVQSICEKLSQLPSIKHGNIELNAQPSLNNSILCFVTGDLAIDGGQPMKFSQVFLLCVGGQQGYYIHHDIFTLNLS